MNIAQAQAVTAGTFHSLASAQLHHFWRKENSQNLQLLSSKVRLLSEINLRFGKNRNTKVALADLALEIEWAKSRMVAPQDYEQKASANSRKPPISLMEMAEIYKRYETEKQRRKLIDFEDLLKYCADAIEQDTYFAQTQHWKWRHFFVDEFQDVNPAQFRLLKAWLGTRKDICVVGDPNQAIYSWNGADPNLIINFKDYFPTAEIISLDDNYRSSPQILKVANTILGSNTHHVGKGLLAHNIDGPIPLVRVYLSDLTEASAIASQLKDCHSQSIAWSHMAVLTRTNAQLVLLEQALQNSQIPFKLNKGNSFLEQREVKLAMAELRKGCLTQSFAAATKDLELKILEPEENDVGSGGDNDRTAHYQNFMRLIKEYLHLDQAPSYNGFNTWLYTLLLPNDSQGKGVELTTFHKAKGLQWPVVFIAGLEKGFVPIGNSNDPALLKEEQRLLYVAATRAENQLYFSLAQKRSFGTTIIKRFPSPFLDSIERACHELKTGQPLLRDPKKAIRFQKDKLSYKSSSQSLRQSWSKNQPSPNESALEALKAWRSNRAKASGVPAYVIFHDSTLIAIATSCPTTEAEMASLAGMGPVKLSRYGEEILTILSSATQPSIEKLK